VTRRCPTRWLRPRFVPSPGGWALPVLCLLAWLLRAAPTWGAEPPPPLAWVPPAQLRLVALSARTPVATLRVVEDVDRPVAIGAGHELLVPAPAGTVVRVEGEGLELGLGFGRGAVPDAVVWRAAAPAASVQEIRVPTWGVPQVVVVRGRAGGAGRATLRVAARRKDPMLWFRADETLGEWLASASEPTPQLPYPLEDAQSVVDFLAAARAAFGADANLPPVRDLLLARWLTDAAPHRNMEAPFFSSVDLVLSGGVPAPPDLRRVGKRPLDRRVVARGQAITVQGLHLDVVTLRIETRADQSSAVRILEGGSLLREERTVIPMQARSRFRWTTGQYFRAVPVHGALRVEVLAGTVRVTAWGYAQRGSVLDPGLRDRERHLRRAAAAADGPEPSATLRVVAALARAEEDRTAAAVGALTALAAQPDLAPGLRALLWHDAIRDQLDFRTLGAHLDGLATATAALPVPVAVTLRRSALERVVAATADVPEGLEATALARWIPPGAAGDEAERLRLFVELLQPPEDRERSLTAARAEQTAARSALSRTRTQLASQAWRRIAPWSNVSAADSSPVVQRFAPVFPEPDSDGLCAFDGSAGVRWLRLDREDRLVLPDRGGTHAGVRFVVDPEAALRDSSVAVEDVPIAVHGGARLGSSVAVRYGTRRFALLGGAPVLAKVPASDRLDCARLRDEVNWTVVRERAVFPLVGGPAPTVASVIVAEEMLGEPVWLEVSVGGIVTRAWVRPPATGALEIPIPPGATALSLVTPRPLMVRVLVRRHRWPSPSPPRAVAGGASPPSEEELVERVRAATRALRAAATVPGRLRAWQDRSVALDALGYHRFAEVDRSRIAAAGGAVVVPDAPPPLPPLALELPSGAPVVVPRGSLPLIPPLPQPADERPLRRALAARDAGEEATRVVAALTPSAARSSAVDALLLAVLAEEVGQPAVAASAYERIGRAHASPRALVRASSLTADAALAATDRSLVLGAYVLARQAADEDPSAAGVLARLQGGISWDAAGADEAAGSVLVEAYRFAELTGAPLGVRVRRALLDAPEFAVLTATDPVITPVGRGSYRVDAVCHDFDGPQEGCVAAVAVDGDPVPCRPIEEEEPPSPLDVAEASPEALEPGHVGQPRTVARPFACWVDVPDDGGRLVVTPPNPPEALAWVAVRQFSARGLEPVRLVSRWSIATADTPLRLLVRGPTVLRLTARGDGGPAQRLERRAVPERGTSVTSSLPLDARVDTYAWRRPHREPVGPATTDYLTLPDPGLYAVVLAPDRGRALIRVEVARASGMPRAAGAAAPEPVELPPAEPIVAAAEPRPVVGWDPALGPLTLGADLSYVVADRFDADFDPGNQYAELALSAQRRLDGSPTWLRLTLFARERVGPETLGAEARVAVGRTALHPAGFVLARVLGQRFSDVTATGFFGMASAQHDVPLTRNLDLVGVAALSARAVDARVADEDHVDLGVYSRYSEAHPLSLDLVARLDERFYVDLRGRVGAQVRLLPEHDVVDRVDGFVQATLLGGVGLAPEVGAELRVSGRPTTDVRDIAFTRLLAAGTLGLVDWHGYSSRLSCDGALAWSVDIAEGDLGHGQVAAMLGVGYDHVGRRGVRDLDPGERSFPARQEEGHAPPDRVPPRSHPYWEKRP
jgi:hypothetical protein